MYCSINPVPIPDAPVCICANATCMGVSRLIRFVWAGETSLVVVVFVSCPPPKKPPTLQLLSEDHPERHHSRQSHEAPQFLPRTHFLIQKGHHLGCSPRLRP